jgi:hypothetical protein
MTTNKVDPLQSSMSTETAWYRRRITLIRVMFVLLLCFSLLAGILAYRASVISLEAERTHQAYLLVLDLLEKHLRANSGRWPTSWEELAKTSLDSPRSFYQWPGDIQVIRQRVSVSFDIGSVSPALNDSHTFSLVKQNGPNFGKDEIRIRRILQLIDSRKTDRQPSSE